MAQIDGMLLEIENYTNNANKVKEAVLERLLSDKVITEGQLRYYSENWQIIIIKQSWFKKWMSAFAKKETGAEYQFKYVKFED